MKKLLLNLLFACFTISMAAQIFTGEGVNMPGAYNAWSNVPSNLAFANPAQAGGGRLVKIPAGTPRWQTIFSSASSGGDVLPGFYEFKFSSGPTSNYWANVWGNTAVTMNTLQTTVFGAGPNNSIVFLNGYWYTMNFIDNGYSSTQMIFMETSAQPVDLNSLSQLPVNGNVTSSDPVVVTVNASATPSPEEIVYVRYSVDGFITSSLALVTFVGSVGTATIPAFPAATQVDYYAFSTTVSGPPVADADKVTIKYKNNGGGNFTYTVNSPIPPVNITFQVDMSQQTVGGSVNIAGNFTGWSPVAMTNAGGGLYTYDALLNQGASIQYKFVNGASYEPNQGAPCGNGFDRTYTVGTSAATIPVVCFGSCSTCPPVNAVTFQANLVNETVGGNVYINGSFPPANWTTPQLMTPAGGGVYTYTVTLPQGASYEYKYINGATYENNLGAPCGNGNNRTITVPAASSTTIPLTCFSYCNDCLVLRQVTFNVNMAALNVSPSGVHLAGSFGTAGYPDWSPSGIAMADPNSDGIYSVTLSLPQNASYEYKFLNGNTWGTDEGVPGGCSVSGNRAITIPTANTSIAPVCFGSCSNCSFAVTNDSPYTAATVYYSSNVAYPNCYSITGTTAAASNSPQSLSYTGNDVWYRFTAQSTAVSITLSSTTMDDAIELYSKSGSSFVLMPGGTENVSSGIGDFERLNYSGLTPGVTYYVSVGSQDNSNSGAYTLCIQHLMPSGCSYAIPPGGFGLCNSYKAIYRGSPAQGVTYDFNFTGVGGGASGTTTLSGTNGLITLSSPALALRYGGIYDVAVDVHYALQNSAATTESILVTGSSASTNCDNVSIMAQPFIEVKSSQRCPATLLRSNYLIGTPVTGSSNACSAISYTYEFTSLDVCGGTTNGLPTEYTTSGATPYLALGNLSNLPNTGAWRIRIRPNFSYGIGTYGPAQDISVNNTAAASMLPNDAWMDNEEKSGSSNLIAAIYPNPSTGTLLNINMDGLDSESVFVRISDYTGRMVFSNRYVADGSLNTVIVFDQPLPAGVYMVEFIHGTTMLVEKMIVQK